MNVLTCRSLRIAMFLTAVAGVLLISPRASRGDIGAHVRGIGTTVQELADKTTRTDRLFISAQTDSAAKASGSASWSVEQANPAGTLKYTATIQVVNITVHSPNLITVTGFVSKSTNPKIVGSYFSFTIADPGEKFPDRVNDVPIVKGNYVVRLFKLTAP